MFRYILVPAPGAETHDAVFRTALAVARLSAGHLDFLHVRLDITKLAISMSAADFAGAGVGMDGVLDSLQRDADARHDRAKAAVHALCARDRVALADAPLAGGPSATFRVETGDEVRLVAAHARTADLTVLGRAGDGEPVMLDALEAVLLESGRPLLIAPARPPEQIGRHIAIAWKDTPEAARAVAGATPLLHAAETVTVVAVPENSRSGTESGERLCRALLWHNPATTLRVVPSSGRDPGEVLLSTVEASGADLLVMGGYGHSRMREVVFGGVTRRVLRAAGLPVLMAH
ncbi:MAG TPA: universal stress protein [Acetobacteraceae bacterium]|nr:universal stress protein [Acetobacteraceae bacterium]